jgi:molecular chaperone DnaJ
MSQQDYYQTLSVARDAGEDDIRKAYRKLARKHHPDLNPGDKASEDRFKKVQEAYDVLSDSKKKAMYDQYGFYSENGMPGGAPGAGGQRGAPLRNPRIFRIFSASGSAASRMRKRRPNRKKAPISSIF